MQVRIIVMLLVALIKTAFMQTSRNDGFQDWFCRSECVCSLYDTLSSTTTDFEIKTQELEQSIQLLEREIGYNIALRQKFRDCEELHETLPNLPSGVYPVYLDGQEPAFHVYCEMEEGGAWTRVVRRYDGSVDFNLAFVTLRNPVGNPSAEHFIGLTPLHYLTSSGHYWLMAELWHLDEKRVSIHEGFSISGESTNFTLNSGLFSSAKSNVTDDALVFSNGAQFSARDANNDEMNDAHCADVLNGPGWFKDFCGQAHIFGPDIYRASTQNGDLQESIFWYFFDDGDYSSISELTLKVRRTAP